MDKILTILDPTKVVVEGECGKDGMRSPGRTGSGEDWLRREGKNGLIW